jgi:hypothetical protein
MVVRKTNVLGLNLIQSVREYAAMQETVRTNHRNWNGNVVSLSGPIYLIALPDLLTQQIKSCLVSVFDEFNFAGLHPVATYTLGGRFSFIPWHDDSNHVFSVTVYLNDFWDRDWGGYFMYEKDGLLGAVAPEFNTAVGFICPLQHCTTMPSINAPLRESIQIFFDKDL